jgi:hypothetical protein
MPTPNAGESKSDYISRCIPYVIKEEGASQDQAVGKCYGLWKYFQKKKNITERINDYLEEQGTTTADVDITPCDNKKKKRKLARRLHPELINI